MSNEKQCGLCKYVKVRRKFLGGKKFICSIQKREVSGGYVCPKFVLDGERAMKYARFRRHEFGSPAGCDTCTHCGSTHIKTGTIYNCKMNNVEFWPGFSPIDYVCDHFKNGGSEALISRLADLLIEQDQSKKGGS